MDQDRSKEVVDEVFGEPKRFGTPTGCPGPFSSCSPHPRQGLFGFHHCPIGKATLQVKMMQLQADLIIQNAAITACEQVPRFSQLHDLDLFGIWVK